MVLFLRARVPVQKVEAAADGDGDGGGLGRGHRAGGRVVDEGAAVLVHGDEAVAAAAQRAEPDVAVVVVVCRAGVEEGYGGARQPSVLNGRRR
jgi:hypothetical protein